MKMYRCLFPACGCLIPESGYCDKHKAWAEQNKAKPFENARRSNEELYKTEKWRTLRNGLLRVHPFCTICGSSEKLQVHHIDPPRGNPAKFYDVGNLSVVCAECHRTITQAEIIRRRKK